MLPTEAVQGVVMSMRPIFNGFAKVDVQLLLQPSLGRFVRHVSGAQRVAIAATNAFHASLPYHERDVQ
jgi:hypothetical protein